MDPILLAGASTAATLLAQEVAKGAASEAGKRAWTALLALFGWGEAPPAEVIAGKVAAAIVAQPDMLPTLLNHLSSAEGTTAGVIVNCKTYIQGNQIATLNIY